MSYPSWVRGLKSYDVKNIQTNSKVVPFVGTWIEINVHNPFGWSKGVVPFVGTWIEIKKIAKAGTPLAVVPFVGTWIEI